MHLSTELHLENVRFEWAIGKEKLFLKLTYSETGFSRSKAWCDWPRKVDYWDLRQLKRIVGRIQA